MVIYKQENVPLGGNTCLGCGPFELGQFWCREQHFSPVASTWVYKSNAPLVCYTSGSNTDAQCNIWAKAPLTQPVVIQKWSFWGGWVVGRWWGISLFTTPCM